MSASARIPLSQLIKDPKFISYMAGVKTRRIDEVLGKVPTVMNDYNGVTMAPTFRPEIVKYINENWIPRKDDVFLFSFMKSGSHWAMHALEYLMFNDEELEFIKNHCHFHHFIYGAPPIEKLYWLDKMDMNRLLLGHQPVYNVPVRKFIDHGGKFLYIYRNPKDAAVSAFHFRNKSFRPDQRIQNWDEPGECILDHVKGWYEYIDNKNVMFLCYEEMQKDMPKQLRRLSNFLGVQKSDLELIEIAQKLQFDVEKRKEDQVEFQRDIYTNKLGVKRKGIVGDWKNHFTEEQSKNVDKLVEEKLKGTNIKYIYALPFKSYL